ncbi:MAG TPA: enoyl-CoA hydratase/isomerase family protein [Vicinamibacteria bacterium]|nr:enoyl-CoA hydratase/isomerase family protein [Vicinamibacteria bacterium]
MQTTFEFVVLENDGAVARILLRRPPLNVLNLEMIRELNRALRDVRPESGLRALVLAAEGKAFSAGVSVEDHLPDNAGDMLGAFHETFRQLRTLCCPTIAAVQGAALGGGCELACFADWVIASESATFGLPEIKLGAFPPIAAVHFPHRIGLARTLQLILSGDTLPAREAERIGLVDRVVPAADLPAALEEAVQRLREKSGPALRLAKRAVLLGSGRDFDAALADVERLFLEKLMKTRDAEEGLRAFLEKRAPQWTHH